MTFQDGRASNNTSNANESFQEQIENWNSRNYGNTGLNNIMKGIRWSRGHQHSPYVQFTNATAGQKYKIQDLFKEQSGKVSEMFEAAMALEKACEEKLSKKGVYANVDFYSGILYKEIGIPVDLFTALFAISRTSGWLAHWIEQVGNNKIFRPTQIYKGYKPRAYKKNQ